jgi:dipicolinic acid synthetase A subunit
VLAGSVSERVEDVLQQQGIGWNDYYERESLLKQNAYLTAEATLQLVMQNLKHKIKNTKVLVIGSGRCGVSTAKLFKKTGAKVTLTSRKFKDKIKTFLIGVKPEKTANLSQIVCEYQVIINTVPHPVLTENVLKNIPDNAFVVELASSAAGVDLKAAEILQDAGYDLGTTGKNKDGVDGIWGKKSQAALDQALKDGYVYDEKAVNIYKKEKPKLKERSSTVSY